MGRSETLASLRSLLRDANLDAYIVYTSDAHQSEFVAPDAKRREFLSGFAGSAGTAVVTASRALLWTDGRYYAQAEQELDASLWDLMRATGKDTPSVPQYLATHIPSGGRVGVDPVLISVVNAREMEDFWRSKGCNISLVSVPDNLVDSVWGAERPKTVPKPVAVFDEEFAGVSPSKKFTEVRASMKAENATSVLLTNADDIAWLLNIRGEDVEYNVGVLSYCILTMEHCFWFVDTRKIGSAVRSYLGSIEVIVHSYEDVLDDVQNLKPPGRMWIDPMQCNLALRKLLGDSDVLELTPGPVATLKAVKNEVELQGMRLAHLFDGAALVRFFAWLQEALEAGQTDLTESSVAAKLEHFRHEQPYYSRLSFRTISAVGSHAAVIHYAYEEGAPVQITKNEVYLLDSGAHYRCGGTTDVTRTVHFGVPTPFQRRCFTRVLQGHIAIDTAVFPAFTTGESLDLLARLPLWREGLNYEHGTGHGVGAFGNVHEFGPAIHAARLRKTFRLPLAPGMCVSNGLDVSVEPGYYHAAEFGIRIENVLAVKEVNPSQTYGPFLGFECLTYVPLDRKLIDVSLLTSDEVGWVNAYHAQCRDRIMPLLNGEERVQSWLVHNTQPIQ